MPRASSARECGYSTTAAGSVFAGFGFNSAEVRSHQLYTLRVEQPRLIEVLVAAAQKYDVEVSRGAQQPLPAVRSVGSAGATRSGAQRLPSVTGRAARAGQTRTAAVAGSPVGTSGTTEAADTL